MFKENGRLKPAENIEIAKLKGKIYKCNKCGREIEINKTEFATTIFCEICGGVMDMVS